MIATKEIMLVSRTNRTSIPIGQLRLSIPALTTWRLGDLVSPTLGCDQNPIVSGIMASYVTILRWLHTKVPQQHMNINEHQRSKNEPCPTRLQPYPLHSPKPVPLEIVRCTGLETFTTSGCPTYRATATTKLPAATTTMTPDKSFFLGL